MKKIITFMFFISFISIQVFPALTGRQIIEESEKLPSPKSAKTQVLMIINKGKMTMEKEFLLFQKTIEGQDRVLFTFLRPSKIKVLTHTNKNRGDDQWIKLSSGKVKRIVGEEKGGSFAQSHMTYEDIESRNIDDYQYNNLGTATAMGVQCYKVESIPTKIEKSYDKAYLYVRTSDYYVVKIDFFKNGKIYKTLENSDIKTISGILTPMKVTVKMADKSGQTEMTVKKVVYNIGIENSKFAKENL